MTVDSENVAISVGNFLNKLNLNLTYLTGRFSSRSRFFQIVNLLQEGKHDLERVGDKEFRILSLDETFNLDRNLYNVSDFFKEKDRTTFFKAQGEVCAEINGFTIAFPFPQGILSVIYSLREDVFGFYPLENSVVLDVGAFVGESAIYFAEKGARKVVAFEPAPPLFKYCQRNVATNHLQNIIQMRPEAVSTCYSEVRFNYIENSPAGGSIYFPNENPTYYKVKTVPFDDIVREIGKIDLLKMNCEGEELKIIPEAQKNGTLKNIINIIIQIHGKPEKVLDILQKENFKVQKSCKEMFYLSQS